MWLVIILHLENSFNTCLCRTLLSKWFLNQKCAFQLIFSSLHHRQLFKSFSSVFASVTSLSRSFIKKSIMAITPVLVLICRAEDCKNFFSLLFTKQCTRPSVTKVLRAHLFTHGAIFAILYSYLPILNTPPKECWMLSVRSPPGSWRSHTLHFHSW